MCDCADSTDDDAALWWKAIGALILGGLIASLITDPRAGGK